MSDAVLASDFDQLLHSPVRAETVTLLYQLYLGRTVSPPEIAFVLDKGMIVAQLEDMLIDSEEYRQKGRLLGHWARGLWDGSLLLVAPARMIFCPIAKVANTSVKHWVLKLLGQSVADPELVHAELDEGRGPFIQARHHSFGALHQAFTHPDWVKVALLRDPAERLVSCYWDKFVLNRHEPSVQLLTIPAYALSYGTDKPTQEQLLRGISFRAFCRYINANPVAAMDSHWAPQARYLENHRWDRLFALDQIDLFERFVLNRCPPELRHIRLGLDNASPRHPEPVLADLSDALPSQMEIYAKPPDAAFLSPDIQDFIRAYYAMDYVLLQTATTTAD